MNILILQCGGPTPVLNASLAAIISKCQEMSQVGQIWGCPLGMQGLIQGEWVFLNDLSKSTVAQIRLQPGAILGAGRYRLADSEMSQIIERLQQKQIHTLFVIGGNGTMAAGQYIAQRSKDSGYPLQVIGIPKTVDNDLVEIDCAPGYGSAARFIAQTTRDIGADLVTMRNYDDVAVLEVMGRHAGWLTAATALARQSSEDAPHLILLPEVPFAEDDFLQRVQQLHQQKGICLVAASEGICDKAGRFLAEKNQQAEQDGSGQKMLSLAAGVAPYLANLIRMELGILCRQMRPDTIQRSSSALVSEVDRHLAEQVGRQAVVAALDGATDVMVGLSRIQGGWETKLVPLEDIIGRERVMPSAYIDVDNFDVTASFLSYVRPLVGELRENVSLGVNNE